MASIESLRNNIIDKLLTISNKEYLTELYDLLSKSNNASELVKLSKAQKMILTMSEKDIMEGQVFTQKQIDEEDLEWLKGQ